MVVLSLFVVWTARRHLRGLVLRALNGRQEEHGEVISPRIAVFAFLAGVFFLVAWLAFPGLSFYVAVLLVLGVLIVFVGGVRIVDREALLCG